MKTNCSETEKLLDHYSKWLRSQYHVKKLGDTDEVTTPFLNTIVDNIRIYVKSLNGNQIELSDDGITLQDLELSGINMSASTRRELLSKLKKEFHVHQRADTLLVQGSIQNFPRLKQNFLLAIIRIDDLANTKHPNVENLFSEEVYDFLDSHDFGGLREHPFNGNSGVTYSTSYVIPARKSKPFRLIDLQSNLSFNQMMCNAYKFEDIQKNAFFSSKKLSYTIIFNDQEKHPSKNSLKIANQSDIKLIAWKDKQQLLSLR